MPSDMAKQPAQMRCIFLFVLFVERPSRFSGTMRRRGHGLRVQHFSTTSNLDGRKSIETVALKTEQRERKWLKEGSQEADPSPVELKYYYSSSSSSSSSSSTSSTGSTWLAPASCHAKAPLECETTDFFEFFIISVFEVQHPFSHITQWGLSLPIVSSAHHRQNLIRYYTTRLLLS